MSRTARRYPSRHALCLLLLTLLSTQLPRAAEAKRKPSPPPARPKGSVSAVSDGASAEDLAAAIGVRPADIVSTNIAGTDSSAVGVATGHLGEYFPTQGQTFAILSTGRASHADLPNSHGHLSTILTGTNNSQGNDLVQWFLTLKVPRGINCARFDFAFYSEEYPEWVGSRYNDTFTAEYPESDLAIQGDTVSSTHNIAFDKDGHIISVNTTFGYHLGTQTTYDGVTPLLEAATKVIPGETATFVFTVQDLGDSYYDSAVFLDNFRWSSDLSCNPGSGTTLTDLATDVRIEDASGGPAAPIVSKYQDGYVDVVLTLTNLDASADRSNLTSTIEVSPADAIVGECKRYATTTSSEHVPVPGTVNTLARAGTAGATRQQIFRCHVSPDAIPDGQDSLTVSFKVVVTEGNASSEPLEAHVDIVRTADLLLVTNRALLFSRLGGSPARDAAVRDLLASMYAVADNHRGVVLYADLDEFDDDAHTVRNWDPSDPTIYENGRQNAAAQLIHGLIEDAYHHLTPRTIVLGTPVNTTAPRYLALVGDDDVLPMYRYKDPSRAIKSEVDYASNLNGAFRLVAENEFILLDHYYAAVDDNDFARADYTLAVGRILGPTPEALRTLLLARSIDQPTGRIALASSDGFDLLDVPDIVTAIGFDAVNDDESEGTVTIDNDDWEKQDLIDAVNCKGCVAPRGVDLFLVDGHATHWMQVVDDRIPNTNGTQPGPHRGVFTWEDFGDDPSQLFRIDDKPHFVFLLGCHSGFPYPSSETLAYIHLDQNAVGFIGLTGYGWASTRWHHFFLPGASWAEDLQNTFVKQWFPDWTGALASLYHTSQPIGAAFRDAKRRYWNDSSKDCYADKTAAEFILYGPPWLTLRYPDVGEESSSTDDAAVKDTGYTVDVEPPTDLGGGLLQTVIHVTIDDWEIMKDGGFDFVYIPGARQREHAEHPVLPLLDVYELAKPVGFVLDEVTAVPGDLTDLGDLQMAGFFPQPFGDNAEILVLGPARGEGLFPKDQIDVAQDRGSLRVYLLPVRHDPATHETTLHRSWDISLRYRVTSDLTLAALHAAPCIAGAKDVKIPVVVTYENHSSRPLVVASEVQIAGQSQPAQVVDLGPGQSRVVSLSWSGDLAPGPHLLTVNASVDREVMATRSTTIDIREGEIVAFDGPGAVTPGDLATFNVTLHNNSTEVVEAGVKVAIVDALGTVVAGIPTNQEIAPGETVTIPLEWNTDGVEEGPYWAQLSVVSQNGPWGGSRERFSIGITNQPPVADAGPDQVVECKGSGGTSVQLDGSGSHDPDGDGITYTWTGDFPEGHGTVTGVHPTVTVPLGTTVIRLIVSDGDLDSAPDHVAITVRDTTPPDGTITFPPTGACLAGAVTVEDSFTDICDDELERSYEPGPGPTYQEDGEYAVTVTATDESGNASDASVSFIVDNEPPVVVLTAPGVEQDLPRREPLSRYVSTSDDDAAPGGVVYERAYINGCLVLDGLTFGDQDGLLVDEEVDLVMPLFCMAYERCGLSEFDDVVFRVEADDCAGNTGVAFAVIEGHYVVDATVCGSSQ